MTYSLVVKKTPSSCYAVIFSFYIKTLFYISVSITQETFIITNKLVVITRHFAIFFLVEAICCHIVAVLDCKFILQKSQKNSILNIFEH